MDHPETLCPKIPLSRLILRGMPINAYRGDSVSGVLICQPVSERSAEATNATGGNRYFFQECGPTTNRKYASSSRAAVDIYPAPNVSPSHGRSDAEKISS